jgi:hypothetical protein
MFFGSPSQEFKIRLHSSRQMTGDASATGGTYLGILLF